MPLPTKETGEVFLEEDLVVKVEMAPYPAVTADHRENLNTQAQLNFLRRLMEQVIGSARISGFSVTADGINVTVNPGELMTKFYYINKSSATAFGQVASDRIVYLRVTTKRVTFEDDPALGITVTGRGTVAGPSIYQGEVTFFYEAGPLPGAISGTGADGTFTRTAGTWVADAEIGKEVEFFDADGRLIGPFVVTDNDTTTLIFKGDATGAVEVRTDHYVLLADVDSVGVVTQNLPLIPTGGSGGSSDLWHEQNTDTHTTFPQFFVNAEDGPTDPDAKRVLTVDDLVSPPAQIGRHPSSILTNGGYELGFDGWNRGGGGVDGEINTDPSHVRTGLQSLQFDVTELTQFIQTDILYEVWEVFDLAGGVDNRTARFEFIGFLQEDAVQPNADFKVWARWLDENQALLSQVTVISRTSTGAVIFGGLTSKVLFPDGVAVPAGAAYLQIRVGVEGNATPAGTWYFDDLRVSRVDSVSELYDTELDSDLDTFSGATLVRQPSTDRWLRQHALYVLVGGTTNQTFSDNTPTSVIWETSHVDPHLFWSGGSPTLLTVPVGGDGIYMGGYTLNWDDGVAPTGQRFAEFLINGGQLAGRSGQTRIEAASLVTTIVDGQGFPFVLVAGDTVEVSCVVDGTAGGTADLQRSVSSFWLARLFPTP